MERVGEEDAVRALLSLDQGVKLREPAVAQTGAVGTEERVGASRAAFRMKEPGEGRFVVWHTEDKLLGILFCVTGRN